MTTATCCLIQRIDRSAGAVTRKDEKCYASGMTTLQTQLPYLAPSQLTHALRSTGYAVLRPADVAALAGCGIDELDSLVPSWARRSSTSRA